MEIQPIPTLSNHSKQLRYLPDYTSKKWKEWERRREKSENTEIKLETHAQAHAKTIIRKDARTILTLLTVFAWLVSLRDMRLPSHSADLFFKPVVSLERKSQGWVWSDIKGMPNNKSGQAKGYRNGFSFFWQKIGPLWWSHQRKIT